MTSDVVTTMFYFRPETHDKPVEGLRAIGILNERAGKVVPSVSMVSLPRVQLEGGGEAFVPTKNQLSKVIMATLEHEPPVIEKGVFRAGSIMTTELPGESAGQRGRRRYTFGAPQKGLVIARFESGLYGGQMASAELFARMTKTADGKFQPTPHGSVDLARFKGGAELVLGSSEGDATEAVKSWHIAWGGSWREYFMVRSPNGDLKVFARRADLWQTYPGSELLVGGCVPDTLFRFFNDGGKARIEKAPELQWRNRFEEALWELQQRSMKSTPAAATAA